MRSCAIGSSLGGVAVACVLAIGACRSSPPAANVPPVTVAPANPSVPITSEGAKDAAPVDAAPITVADAATPATSAAAPRAELRQATFRIEQDFCVRVIVAVAKGSFTVGPDTLQAGDAIVLAHPARTEVKGTGLAVEARAEIPGCAAKATPMRETTVVRANAAPKLEWAGGKMSAHLDVGAKASPELYLGRLEGTAPVAEHAHPGTWEVLAAIEAAGTFTLDGKEQRLGPREIVLVPPGTKHAWRPDPGSKLVAIQMYSPPGPEQRFVGLAQLDAAQKDAGKR